MDIRREELVDTSQFFQIKLGQKVIFFIGPSYNNIHEPFEPGNHGKVPLQALFMWVRHLRLGKRKDDPAVG